MLGSVYRGTYTKRVSLSNRVNATLLLLFLIIGGVAFFWSFFDAKKDFDVPRASVHAVWINDMFWTTMIVIGIVFVITPTLSFIPSHIYKRAGEYTVTLIADNNCTPTTFSKKIVVIEPPVAKFTTAVLPTTACVEARVSTQNQSTGAQLKYQWSVAPDTGYVLAAGSQLTDAEPAFLFNTAGYYRIKLRAYNACLEDTASQKILIMSTRNSSLLSVLSAGLEAL